MQFQVPQFIETEDRVVGPFSIRQFIYVAIAGWFCFILYFAVEFWLLVVLAVPTMGAAFSLAFIKINGVPLTRVAMSAFNFYWKPQTYVWQPEPSGTEKKAGSAAEPGVAASTAGPREGRAAAVPRGISLEDIVSGIALRNAWQNLQTGTKSPPRISGQQFYGKIQEKYEVFRRAAGDQSAARRVDYR